MGRKPDVFNCDFPTCPEDELTDDQVTHFTVRQTSPANPGTVMDEFDTCDEHADKFNKILNDYRR
jgi:hypothetical protein